LSSFRGHVDDTSDNVYDVMIWPGPRPPSFPDPARLKEAE